MGDKDERNTSADQSAPSSDTERGINPVQHSERSQQPDKDKDKDKPQADDE